MAMSGPTEHPFRERKMLGREIGATIFFVVAIFASGTVLAQPNPQFGTTTTPRFQELTQGRSITFSALPALPEPSGELLINGVEADPRHFPTVFRMTTGGTCTAALVGSAALLTAAHCVPDGALIKFVLGTRDVRGLCEHARGYQPPLNKSEDWAMCLLEFPVIGIRYEALAESVPQLGTEVVLTGYGCTEKDGAIDGKLRVGLSQLVDGQKLAFAAETSTIYTRSAIPTAGAILCPGDSGGPLFVVSGNSFNDARTLIGVNSRTTFQFGVSLFAATGSAAGRQFFRDWSERHGQKVCGVNTDQNCRR
jgi:hypothetical protein